MPGGKRGNRNRKLQSCCVIFVGSPPHNTTTNTRHTAPQQSTHHHSQQPPTTTITATITHHHQPSQPSPPRHAQANPRAPVFLASRTRAWVRPSGDIGRRSAATRQHGKPVDGRPATQSTGDQVTVERRASESLSNTATLPRLAIPRSLAPLSRVQPARQPRPIP